MRFEVRDEAGVAAARVHAREVAGRVGLGRVDTEAAAVIVSELAHNQLRHARGGAITIQPHELDGIEVLAVDSGGGIADIAGAFADHASTMGSLGIGLGAVRRLAAEMDVLVRQQEGCSFHVRVRPGGRRGPEVFALGRPHPHEHLSGDLVGVVREGARLLVGLADGLGHGPAAREAAEAAMACLRADETLADTLYRIHAQIQGTRGVAMAIARVEASRVEVAVVGNVRAGVFGPAGTRRASQTPGTLGLRGTPRTVHPETFSLGPQDLLLLWTDGLREQLSVDRPMPDVQLVPHLLEQWGKDSDDATVVLVR